MVVLCKVGRNQMALPHRLGGQSIALLLRMRRHWNVLPRWLMRFRWRGVHTGRRLHSRSRNAGRARIPRIRRVRWWRLINWSHMRMMSESVGADDVASSLKHRTSGRRRVYGWPRMRYHVRCRGLCVDNRGQRRCDHRCSRRCGRHACLCQCMRRGQDRTCDSRDRRTRLVEMRCRQAGRH